MTDQEHWQLDGSAPQLYQRYLVPAITSVWAADLLDRARPQPGETVLDIACGTGVVARMAAERMGTGRVAGLDLNEGMLSVARSVASTGAPIEWREGSALSLPFAGDSYDLVLCQLGLQFFPDRPLALREMKRVLVPSGRVALSVYSAIERTPAADAFARALDRRIGAGASSIKRSEHAFAEPDEVEALIAGAGFGRIEISRVAKQITFPSVLDYVRFQLIATPMAALLRDKPAGGRDDIIRSVAADTRSILAREYLANDRLSFPQESFVALAHRTS